MNCDGAGKENPGHGDAGGVIWNSMNTVRLGVYNAIMADLKSLIHGLQCDLDHRFRWAEVNIGTKLVLDTHCFKEIIS